MPRAATSSAKKSKSKSPSPVKESKAKAKTPKSASKKTPKAPTPASVTPTLDEDDEMYNPEDDEIDEDDILDLFYQLYVEPNDFATKLALRVHYAIAFSWAVAFSFFPQYVVTANATAAGLSVPQQRLIAALFFGRGMVLAAAAQEHYYAQKKALQYNMGYTLAVIALTALQLSEHGKAVYGTLFLALASIGLSLWACYFFDATPKDADELEEEAAEAGEAN